MKYGPFLLATCAFLAATATGQLLLQDDFTSLSPLVWAPATGLPSFVGTPQTANPTTMDGRSVLQVRSDMGNNQRRGWASVQTFSLGSARVEVDFKTLGGIDGTLECWLHDPVAGTYVVMALFAGNFGADRRVSVSTSGGPYVISNGGVWSFGQWYRFVIDADGCEVRVSFRDASDNEIWGHSLNISLPSLGTAFKVALTQGMGTPGFTTFAEAAIDRITLSGSSVPTQTVFQDDFTSFDPQMWGPAANLPLFVGTPQTTSLTAIDGRSVYQIRSDMNDFQRRGYSSIPSFRLTAVRVEVEFYTVGGIDGLLECWLHDASAANRVGVRVFGGSYGTARHVKAFSSAESGAVSALNLWSVGAWYRFVIVSGPCNTRVSLQADSGLEIWGHTFGFGLGSLGTEVHVGLTQVMGKPGGGTWHAESAVDHVRVIAMPGVGDSDSDGLSDSQEIGLGTDPFDPDTDDDGLLDGTEVDMAAGGGCPDPLNPDSDGDTLLDGVEVTQGTNPCQVDSDGDGVNDNLDPLPTQPGVTTGWLEDRTRAVCASIRALDLSFFIAPNNNAKKGRRNSLANRTCNAANAIARLDYSSATDLLKNVRQRLDGQAPRGDWVVESPARQSLATDLQLVIGLLSM